MGKTPFKHPGCNGWAIYDKQYIDAEDARNMHVVEGAIDTNGNYRPNSRLDTVCGRKLKKTFRRHKCPSLSPSDMRSTLAELQKHGEVCGGCVAHFYADPTQP